MSETLLTTPSRVPTPQRVVWIQWMESLGIDPNDVAIPGYVGRDLPNCRVWWRAYVRDELGRPVLAEDGTRYERCPRYVQLEAEPPLFPAEVVGDERVRDTLLTIEWA